MSGFVIAGQESQHTPQGVCPGAGRIRHLICSHNQQGNISDILTWIGFVPGLSGNCDTVDIPKSLPS